MNDTIYRQDAIDAINDHFGFNIEEEYGSAVQEVINGLPSAEPERKTGKWMQTATMNVLECSYCHSRWNVYYVCDFDYCPHCGMKMEMEE